MEEQEQQCPLEGGGSGCHARKEQVPCDHAEVCRVETAPWDALGLGGDNTCKTWRGGAGILSAHPPQLSPATLSFAGPSLLGRWQPSPSPSPTGRRQSGPGVELGPRSPCVLLRIHPGYQRRPSDLGKAIGAAPGWREELGSHLPPGWEAGGHSQPCLPAKEPLGAGGGDMTVSTSLLSPMSSFRLISRRASSLCSFWSS